MAAEYSNAAADAKLWPEAIEKKFILFLFEEAIKEHIPFDWQHIARAFNEESGKNHSPKQLQEKFKRLRIKYEAFHHLVSRSDMKYDPATNIVTGNEMAWFNAVKVHSRCVDFRRKGLANYALLGQLFHLVPKTPSAQHASVTYVDKQGSNPEEKQLTYSTTSTEKKRKVESLYRASGSGKTVDSADLYSMDKVTKRVLSIDVDDETRFKALDKLEKVETRQVFMNLTPDLLKSWIEHAGGKRQGS